MYGLHTKVKVSMCMIYTTEGRRPEVVQEA